MVGPTTSLTCATVPVEILLAPVITIANVTTTSVAILWYLPMGNASDGYNLYIRLQGIPNFTLISLHFCSILFSFTFFHIHTNTPSNLTYTYLNLTPNTSYVVEVEALNLLGYSNYSTQPVSTVARVSPTTCYYIRSNTFLSCFFFFFFFCSSW
jgi:hypothetical protein